MENCGIWKCDGMVVKKRGEKWEKKENLGGVQVVCQENVKFKFVGKKKKFDGFVRGKVGIRRIAEDDLRGKVKVRADRNRSQLVDVRARGKWIRNEDIRMEFLLFKTFEDSKNHYSSF